jgi:hypothetical protein
MKKQILTAVALMALVISFSSCEKEDDKPTNGKEVFVRDDISTNTLWTSDKTYIIENSIFVNANLTIEPGTVIKFKTGSALTFGFESNTTLIANGTADNRIVFTSYSPTPTSGSWNGVFFYSNTLQNSSVSFCDFEYAGANDNDAIGLYGCKITFNNNRIKHAKKVAIGTNYYGSFVAMSGNIIETPGTHAISISPNAIHTLGTNNTISCNPGYGILVESGELLASNSTNATWRKQTVPYIFDGFVAVETNLTIEAGTVLKFNAYGLLRFGFESTVTVNAIGTATNPIIFTSSNSTPAAGAWNGIEVFSNTTSNSKFEYCQFNYAGKGGWNESSALYVTYCNGLTVKNCSFNNSAGWGIYLYDSSLSAQSTGNVFNNCANGNMISE